MALSTTVSSTVSGTPSATPLASPKLERMSLRTMPLSVSTLTPFEPSPGYGPAVSSGMVVPQATVAAEAVVAAEVVAAALLGRGGVARVLRAAAGQGDEADAAQGAAGDDAERLAAGDQGLEVEGEAAIVVVDLVVVVMGVPVHGPSLPPGPKTRLRAP